MSDFKPILEVSTAGVQRIGVSPHGAVSILSDGVTCTAGVFIADTFYPHADGALAPGEMLTFEVGSGRAIGVDVTAGTGRISTAKV